MRKSLATIAVLAATSMTVVGLAPAAAAADGLAEAQSIVAKYSKNPTSIGLPVISKPIPKGKHVISFTKDTIDAQVVSDAYVQAGRLLGWDMEVMESDLTLKGFNKTLNEAIAKKPDGIIVTGLGMDNYVKLFKRAKAAGVVMVCSACDSAPTGPVISTHVAGPKMLDLWSRMIAAYAVANSSGTPKVQAFGVSAYKILDLYDKAFAKNLKQLSPSASYTFNELTFAPDQVATTYKANPDTTFISSDLGAFSGAWSKELLAAGATPGQKPLLGGLNADQAAIQGLKDKTTNAWTGYSLPIVGYSVVDELARYWANVPLSKVDLPSQILTQQNIGTAVLDSAGYYVGIKDYQAQFKKVWGLK